MVLQAAQQHQAKHQWAWPSDVYGVCEPQAMVRAPQSACLSPELSLRKASLPAEMVLGPLPPGLRLRTMHGGGSAPSCCAFTHRVAFEEGSGPRVGEGNGTLLQYSCLENPMNGGAWWAAVHGVARVGHD